MWSDLDHVDVFVVSALRESKVGERGGGWSFLLLDERFGAGGCIRAIVVPVRTSTMPAGFAVLVVLVPSTRLRSVWRGFGGVEERLIEQRFADEILESGDVGQRWQGCFWGGCGGGGVAQAADCGLVF